MKAEASGEPYTSFESLDAARADPDGAVILEGDWGGQIYLAVPAPALSCTEQQLQRLLEDLDAIAWSVNDGDGARVVYERRSEGEGVAGGMGGGRVAHAGWVHPRLVEMGLEAEIRDVLQGVRERLSDDARARPRQRRRPDLPLWEAPSADLAEKNGNKNGTMRPPRSRASDLNSRSEAPSHGWS
jgi:hypothetical protein